MRLLPPLLFLWAALHDANTILSASAASKHSTPPAPNDGSNDGSGSPPGDLGGDLAAIIENGVNPAAPESSPATPPRSTSAEDAPASSAPTTSGGEAAAAAVATAAAVGTATAAAVGTATAAAVGTATPAGTVLEKKGGRRNAPGVATKRSPSEERARHYWDTASKADVFGDPTPSYWDKRATFDARL